MITCRIVSMFAIFFLIIPGISAHQRAPYPGPVPDSRTEDSCPDLDVLHYDLDLSIIPENQILDGIVSMNVRTEGETLDEIILDLVRLSVSSVLEGANSVTYRKEGDLLIISPDVPLSPGQTRTFTIAFGGQPTNEGSFGGFFFSGGVAFSMGVGLYTDPPSMGRYWFPCHDHPSDKATEQVILRVPQNWYGVSGGALISDVQQDSLRITTWATDYPITTYLMMVAAGPYSQISDDLGPVPIRHYVRMQDVSNANQSFARVPQMIDLFIDLFGDYPFERFGYVAAPIGAMEHQTCVTYPWQSIDGTLTDEWLAAHELGHMWWGDCITYADWTQIWVSEGFATYCQALWEEEINGPAGYRQEMVRQMQEYLGGVAGEGYFPLNAPEALWGVCTYEKGSCILHMLRQEIGDSLFFAGLAEYRARHEYGNATTDSVELAFEAASGHELTWFFDQWIREPGHPRLSFRYAVVPCADGSAIIDAEINQIQTIGPVFRFTFEIAADLGDTTYRHSFIDSTAFCVTSFSVPGTPEEVTFDQYHKVLFSFEGAEEMERLELISVVIDDDGDNDGGLDPGEDAEIIATIHNPLSELQGLTMTLISMDDDVEVIQETASIATLPASGQSDNASEPFRIHISGTENKPVHLVVSVELQNGGIVDLPLDLYVGTARRLIVDADLPENDYETYFTSAIDTLPDGQDFELWSTGLLGPLSEMRLAKYADQGMVVWFTGDADSTALSPADCSSIMTFLDADGKIFLTGQNAVDTIDSFQEGAELLSDYLCIDVTDTDFQTNRTIEGEDDDIIGNELRGLIQGDGAANNQTSLTHITPLQGAIPVMHFFGREEHCGTRAEEHGRVVVYSFGFEAINQTQPQFLSREQMIRRVANWLEGGTPAEGVPDVPILSMNIPTPYHPNSAIRMDLHEEALVTVKVFDLAGREVVDPVSRLLPAGTSIIRLPDELSPGVHVVIAEAHNEKVRKPLVCMP